MKFPSGEAVSHIADLTGLRLSDAATDAELVARVAGGLSGVRVAAFQASI